MLRHLTYFLTIISLDVLTLAHGFACGSWTGCHVA